MENEKLRLCPFCGGKPFMQQMRFFTDKVPRYGVTCPVCSISIGWYFQPDEAAKRWNTRPRGSDKRDVQKAD